MKNIVSGLACLGMASGLHAGEGTKPNIVVIFTDDHGYADLGVQRQLDDLKTPNLDRLAADGVRCTSGYITAPQCIPSRAGILSGRYQQRFGVDDNGTIPMPLDETLIPSRLQKVGYTTGMVGKWHLDPNHQQTPWLNANLPNASKNKHGHAIIPHTVRRPYLPDVRGFTDSFCGHINNYWANYDLKGNDIQPPRGVREEGYRLDIQTEAALTFIERNRDDPFFLYLAYFAPHVPLDATEKYLSRFPENMPRRRRIALAMLAAIDDGVGRIRDKLATHGLTDNTVIFFVSDNGAPLKIDRRDAPGNGPGWDGSRNDPWVGEKGMLTEGGIRVPFIVTWPGTLPANKVYDQPITSLDVGATAVALAGLPVAPELDGKNIIPYLSGEKDEAPHEYLFWRFWNQSAVRRGKWKYLQAGQRQYLFDLESEEHEHQNLLEKQPDVAAELKAALMSWADTLKTPGMAADVLNRQELKFYDHYLSE